MQSLKKLLKSLRICSQKKSDGNVSVSFFAAGKLDISLCGKALFKGNPVGKTNFQNPMLNFNDEKQEAKTQHDDEVNWTKPMPGLIPAKINLLTIWGGEIYFRNYDTKPPVDVYLHKLSFDEAFEKNSDKTIWFRPSK